jgi:hypothetical protein
MEIIPLENNIEKNLKKGVTSRLDLLMDSLTKFFNNNDNVEKMLPIVQGSSKISLRILDWFVTNYCKKNNVVIDSLKDKTSKKIIVHLDYKSQLKAYSKKQFDPFCRRERISFNYGKGNELITTVGQLNFFRWIIENNVIDFIQDNLEQIEKDMNTSIRSLYKDTEKTDDSESSEQKKRRKRHELSLSATRSVSKHNVTITIDFS